MKVNSNFQRLIPWLPTILFSLLYTGLLIVYTEGVPYNYDDYEIFFVDFHRYIIEKGDLFGYLSISRHGYISPFYRFLIICSYWLYGEISLRFVGLFWGLFWLIGINYLVVHYVRTVKWYYSLPLVFFLLVWSPMLTWTGVTYYIYILLFPIFIFLSFEKDYLITGNLLLLFYVLNVGSSIIVLLLVLGLCIEKAFRQGMLTYKLSCQFIIVLLFGILYFFLISRGGREIAKAVPQAIYEYVQFLGAPALYAMSDPFRPDNFVMLAFIFGLLIFIAIILVLYQYFFRRNVKSSYFLTLLFLLGSGLLITFLRPNSLYPRYEYIYFSLWAAVYVCVLDFSRSKVRQTTYLAVLCVSFILFCCRIRGVQEQASFKNDINEVGLIRAISGGGAFGKVGSGFDGRDSLIEESLVQVLSLGGYRYPNVIDSLSEQSLVYSQEAIGGRKEDFNLSEFSFIGRYYIGFVLTLKELRERVRGEVVSIDLIFEDPDRQRTFIYPLTRIEGYWLGLLDVKTITLKEKQISAVRLSFRNGNIVFTT